MVKVNSIFSRINFVLKFCAFCCLSPMFLLKMNKNIQREPFKGLGLVRYMFFVKTIIIKTAFN